MVFPIALRATPYRPECRNGAFTREDPQDLAGPRVSGLATPPDTPVTGVRGFTSDALDRLPNNAFSLTLASTSRSNMSKAQGQQIELRRNPICNRRLRSRRCQIGSRTAHMAAPTRIGRVKRADPSARPAEGPVSHLRKSRIHERAEPANREHH